MTGASPKLSERYGVTNSPTSWNRARTVFIVALAVMLAATVWVTFAFVRSQSVKASTLGYEHSAPDAITVTYSVTMAPGTTAECSVEALGPTRAQVGFTVVRIPVQPERVSVHTTRVLTQQEAVSGAVKTCRPVDE